MKYVGIDIGDGESAVSVVSRDGALLPTVVPLGNANSIRSIVGPAGRGTRDRRCRGAQPCRDRPQRPL